MPLRLFMVAPSAMLTDHEPHGDGLVAYGFLRELAARGHELHVAAGRVRLRHDPPDVLQLYRVARPEGDPLSGRFRFWSSVRRLYRRLSAERAFDLVHQLTPVEVGVTLGLSSPDTPLVLGPYVPDWVPGEDAATRQPIFARHLKQGVRAIQQRGAATVLVSNLEARRLVPWKRGVEVHELPLGVDSDAWHPPSSGGEGQDVLFLANLDRRKGIHVLLDAFAQLSARFPDGRLLVAGGGPEAARVKERIRGESALRSVELLGHLDRQRSRAAMQACDVYCLPSFGEPFGLTALEAMACGKPVVATDAGGLRDVVPEGGGCKVPPGDAGALASALAKLLGDPSLRRRMGAHNRAVVEARYSWPTVVGRLEDLYRAALTNHGGGRIRS